MMRKRQLERDSKDGEHVDEGLNCFGEYGDGREKIWYDIMLQRRRKSTVVVNRDDNQDSAEGFLFEEEDKKYDFDIERKGGGTE